MQTQASSVINWWPASRASDVAAFGAPVELSIDGKTIQAPAGASILNAASVAGIYIPALCAHPDLPPAQQRGCADKGGAGCNLCLIEIEGTPGMSKACSSTVSAGMVVRTNTPHVQKARQDHLAKILGPHPHVCLVCPQREGCSRSQCSYGNPPETRCCSIFSSCELRKVSDYVGIPNTTPPYKPAKLPVITNEPFFDRDYNLCIDCRRCLVACNDVRGVGCLEVKEVQTAQGVRRYVGTIAATLIESGCKFCQACVTVCPTGALTDRTLDPGKREESMVPCKAACPAGIDVPRYVQLAAEGKYGEAIAVVREKLPFPGIVGRACFAMCESACRRGKLDDPLSIRSLKRIAGVAAHDLRVIVECEKAGIDVDFYQKTFHSLDYYTAPRPGETGALGPHDNSWCQDPQAVIDVMAKIKKPWIAFKVLAAGAIQPRAAFPFAFNSGADFALVGMFDWQIVEDTKLAKRVINVVAGANSKRTRPWC